jgi:hypothetical protein
LKFVLVLFITALLHAEEHGAPKQGFFSQRPTVEMEGGNHGYHQITTMVPVWNKIDVEGNVYRAGGGEALSPAEHGHEALGNHSKIHDDVGFVGASYSLGLGKHLQFHPGIGVLFGAHEPAGAALKGRLFANTKYAVSEVSAIKGLRSSVPHHRDLFAEGHVSAKVPVWGHRHAELGVTGENFSHLEERERVGGLRAMVPIPGTKHFNITAKVMSQNTFRVGIAILPHE